ncbi:MAG: phenylalanine--tRNA ligase subunit beta, partial [Anaerovorax sp.]
MMCSPEELGFADKVVPLASKDGIWLLEGEFPLGEDIVSALGLSDYVVDFEITPNRPDCLAMLGMAKEASATFSEDMKRPDTSCECKGEGVAADYISVEIKSPELCPRYTARIITDVKIAQSPWWLQKRLMYAGQRPINNIVDITNFVMLEYGQPLHAFDVNTVEDRKIIVNLAQEGQAFTTLDNKERTLTSKMLMINDGKKPIAIAGVMGGLNSEIAPDTKTVILESANFYGDSVRLTSKKLGLRTEASARYEKGIDPNLCGEAADRFCKLVEMLDAGRVVPGSVDVYPSIKEPKGCNIRISRINKVLGIELPAEEIKDYLEKLGIQVSAKGDILLATPPTIRNDLAIEEDFIEEVARLYGYDKLPMTLPKSNNASKLSKSWQLRELAKDCMIA